VQAGVWKPVTAASIEAVEKAGGTITLLAPAAPEAATE
jgi:hypothetical protein